MFLAGIFVLTITFSILQFRYNYSDFENVTNTIVGRIKDNFDTIGQNVQNFMTENEEIKVKEGYTLADGIRKTRNSIVTDIASPKHDMKAAGEVDVEPKLVAPLAPGISNESFETVLDTFNNLNHLEYIDKSEVTDESSKVPGNGQQMIESFIASVDEVGY